MSVAASIRTLAKRSLIPHLHPSSSRPFSNISAGKMSVETAVKTFWSSPRFAVAGASSDPNKFGHKVLVWYLSRGLPATPLNPSSSTITFPEGSGLEPVSAVPSPSALSDGKDTALSVITSPKITTKVLAEAKQAGVRAVWLQPGTFDDDVLAYAKKEWPEGVIAGFEQDPSGFTTRGGEGWCVLVDGDNGLKLVGRSAQKL